MTTDENIGIDNIINYVSKLLSRLLIHDRTTGILITPLFRFCVREINSFGNGDRAFIGVNPATEELFIVKEEFEKIPEIERRFALYHEALHIVLASQGRQDSRNHLLWNVATDYEINALLKKNNIEVPNYVLYDPKYDDWYAEAIYNDLCKTAKALGINVNGDGSVTLDKGKWQIDHHPVLSKEEKAKAQMHEKRAAIEVEQQYKKAGRYPLGMDLAIKYVTTPQISWEDLVISNLNNVDNNDYSYRKPNRPQLALNDIYFPSLNNYRREVVVIVDTSGSIDSVTLSRFVSRVVDITSIFRTTVLFIDAEVQSVVEEGKNDWESLVKAVKGGGGTTFAPAFKWIEENIPNTVTAILMTDGYNSDNYIEIPDNIDNIIVLTTEKSPEGFEPSLVIEVDKDTI
jgi:predicted metal-dependent peptidase